jgi:hypothetical protein
MPKMTKSQFEEMFREEILPGLIEHEQQRGSGFPDKPGRREAWNNTVDSYIRDRQLPESAGNWGHPRWLETAQTPSRHDDHAVRAKKSPAQLDREIADVLNGSRRHSHAATSSAAPDWAAGETHARKKKITPQEARRLLENDGLDFSKDFHALDRYDVGRLTDVAKLAGYRKRKDAPGSTVRMFYQYLSRQPSQRSHATRGMHIVYDLVEVNKQTKKERVLHEHFSTRADAKEAQDEYEGYKRPGVSYRIKSRQVPKPSMRWNLED